jgi:DGQHR domain-containing protein
MRDDELNRRFAELSKPHSLEIERLTAADTERAIGLALKGSSNPLYNFRLLSGGNSFSAVAFTLMLNAQTRPATRAEALGHAISTHGSVFFDRNPFLLVFDYATNRFMASSAAKLFSAFATEASARPLPNSDTANFSLTPNFAKRTFNMYGLVEAEDVWFCDNLNELTQEDVTAGLQKIAADTKSVDRDFIVEAVRQRLASKPQTDNQDGRLSFTASLITQGRHKFYSLAMPSEILAECSFVLTRGEDREAGFQRYLSKERAQEIASYIDSGLGTIPSAVILSAQPECNYEYNSKNRTVSFDKIENAFMIIDGQHRVYGFSLAKSTLRVPVIIYSDLDRSEEAQLFIDINGKQKQVPPELLLDVKKLANTQGSTEKKIGIVFDLFDSEPGSALLGLLSPHERKTGLISRVTFNAGIKPLIELFGDAPPGKIYEILNPYFEATKSAFAKLSPEIEITSPMTFRGMTVVFPDIHERVRLRFPSDVNQKSYYHFLLEILSGQKLSPFKGRQKSYAGIVAAINEGMRPKSLI